MPEIFDLAVSIGPLHATSTSELAKMSGSQKGLVEGLGGNQSVYAPPVSGNIGSLAAPNQATLTEESRALQRIAAGPHNAISTQI